MCYTVWLFDENFVLQDRAVGGLTEEKLKYAHETKHISTLPEVVKTIKPTAIIGKLKFQLKWAEIIEKSLLSQTAPELFLLI